MVYGSALAPLFKVLHGARFVVLGAPLPRVERMLDEALLEIDVVSLLDLDVVALCDTVSVRLEVEVSDKLSDIVEVDEAVDDMLMLWDAAVVTDPLML